MGQPPVIQSATRPQEARMLWDTLWGMLWGAVWIVLWGMVWIVLWGAV